MSIEEPALKRSTWSGGTWERVQGTIEGELAEDDRLRGDLRMPDGPALRPRTQTAR